MYLDFTPEQKELRAEIRASLEAVMTPERTASVAGRMEGGDAVKECTQALGAANLLGVGWPKEYGGRGFTALEQFIFFEEAQRVNAPIPLVTLNTVGPTLMVYGSDEQKNKFLPSILDGTVEFAIGYSEPSAGSDLASLRTTAVRDGDDYIINGQKMFTSGAAYADYVWLATRTDPTVKKHNGGTLLEVGNVGAGRTFELDPSVLVYGNKSVRGVMMYNPVTLAIGLSFQQSTGFPFSRLMPEPFHLADINQAYASASAGSVPRGALVP